MLEFFELLEFFIFLECSDEMMVVMNVVVYVLFMVVNFS